MSVEQSIRTYWIVYYNNVDNAESQYLAKSFCGDVYLYCFLGANMRSRGKTIKFTSTLYDWYDSVNFHENSSLNAHLSLIKLFYEIVSFLDCDSRRQRRHSRKVNKFNTTRNGFLICNRIVLLFFSVLLDGGVGKNKAQRIWITRRWLWKLKSNWWQLNERWRFVIR